VTKDVAGKVSKLVVICPYYYLVNFIADDQDKDVSRKVSKLGTIFIKYVELVGAKRDRSIHVPVRPNSA
jgi:hypothetical protein